MRRYSCDNPFAPWNSIDEFDQRMPWNGPDRDDPSAPWNNPFGDDLSGGRYRDWDYNNWR